MFFSLLPAWGCINPGCPTGTPAWGLGLGALPITEPHAMNTLTPQKIPPHLLCELSPARLACRLKFALTIPLQRAGAFLYGDSHRSPGLARPFWQRPWYGTAGQASSAVTHGRVPAVTASRSASPGDGGWTDGRTDGRNVRGRSVGEKGKGPRGRFCSVRVGTGLRQD